MSNGYKHWHTHQDEQNILWLTFDKDNSAVNTIDHTVLNELKEILEPIKETALKGLVIESAKKTGFIAGADINMFQEFDSIETVTKFLNDCHSLFDTLANLPYTTVCLIDGFCLGGGLELALCCNYIIASDNPKTKIGLPEVKLGLHPGWGGTFRTVKRMGPLQAIPFMLTGRPLTAKQAKKQGLIDQVTTTRYLTKAARDFINTKPKTKKSKLIPAILNMTIIRPFIAKMIRKKAAEKVNETHYPAPFKIIDNWLEVGNQMPQAQQKEIETFAELAETNTSKNLIRVFFLQDQLKSLAKQSNFKANRVHVIGGGTMGGDIAIWCALEGNKVTIQDQTTKQLAPIYKRAQKTFQRKLKNPFDIAAANDRLIIDPKGEGILKADIIIEAIFENVEAKQKLFKEIEQKAKPDAILATNTSSIPLTEIASALTNPQRLVGIHFFNPVAKMPLVEVVKTENTDPQTVADAMSFVRSIDKLPLPVASKPGFLVNRVLMPYIMEAILLLEEGVPAEQIDTAATNFGMPMGPIELADTVGLDICLAVGEKLAQAYKTTVPSLLKQKVENDQLGKKNQQGFYTYKNGKANKKTLEKDPQQEKILTERMIQSMHNEAQKCLNENVIENSDLLDAGMIFGTGFAPFHGGLIHYYQNQEKI